jgi:hypothetical protein
VKRLANEGEIFQSLASHPAFKGLAARLDAAASR